MTKTQNNNLIRCDDIFFDSDTVQFEKICQVIKKYDFDHLIGITPLGEGAKIWTSKGLIWKLPLMKSGFANRYALKLTGEKYIGNNAQLLKGLVTEFSKNGAIPALHGLHHYKYEVMSDYKVWAELSVGKKLLDNLFNVNTRIFSPPFNSWNHRTAAICDSLGLSIDHCFAAFDLPIRNMNNDEVEQLAKRQSSISEVFYHPYMVSLEKFEIYIKTRRKYL
jgi:hypothetical protein